MNELQAFTYEGNKVRTVRRGEEIWWMLKDVCGVLGLSNPSMIADRLDDDERAKFDLGRQGKTNIVNESGLYNVILRSDKPEAKKFKRWVTREVLPSIRKHGAYITPEKMREIAANPEFTIALLTELHKEREKNAEMAPKAIFADAVSSSDDSVSVGTLAKIIRGNGVNVGRNRLYEILRQEGYLIKSQCCDRNAPSQMAMDLGLFKIKESVVELPDGRTLVNITTMVTGKGQQYFVNMFLNKRNETNICVN
jgi:anti-repressor protein